MEFNFKTKYLSMATKNEIVKQIVNFALYEENGMLLCDNLGLKSAIDTWIVNFYTDIENPDLDVLYENGVIDEIYRVISREYLLIRELVTLEINQRKEVFNSFAGVINKNLAKLIGVLEKNTDPKTLKSTIKELGKIDLNKLPQIKEIYDTLKAGGVQ